MQQLVLFLVFLVWTFLRSNAQELYVFSNPASNIPARSLMLKAMGKSMVSYHNLEREYRISPEVQVGLHKNLMVAGGVSFSDMFFQNQQQFESFRFYGKYRFLSKDDIHRHFRMAVHGSYAWSNNPLVYQEMTMEGDNSGLQTGIIATGLINKLAVSGGVSYMILQGGARKINFGFPFSQQAMTYNLSAGYLLFPFTYKGYEQLNVNLYCELLGQKNTDLNTGFVDVAPAIQFIIASKMRINAGARFQINGNAHRMANEAIYISMEYNLLNIFK
jgi:hypothetical protein